jgi:hypothetical protein
MLDPTEIVRRNGHLLSSGLTDTSLSTFFNSNFQDIIDDRKLYPTWACMDCMTVHPGERPQQCTSCESDRVFEVATFQARGAATGNVFQEGVAYIFGEFYGDLGIVSSRTTPFRDSCDLYLQDAAGIEAKGSPETVRLPDGTVIELGRPGMRRTDTEKKANSNATTFKRDHPGNVRYYVMTNALPEGWHEETSSIDGIFDATKAKHWEDLIYELKADQRRASRDTLGRR